LPRRAICLSEDAYRQVKGRLDLAANDLGPIQLKNIGEPIRFYSVQVGVPAHTKAATEPLESPLEPKRRSALLPLIAGIAALIVMAGALGISSPETGARPSPRPRRRGPNPHIFPSSYCPSPTCPATLLKTISPTA
jgi:hypothetical protein